MNSEKFDAKTLVLWGLLALAAFLLRGGCEGNDAPKITTPTTIYVPKLDTVTKWEVVAQTRYVVRHDTIRDRVEVHLRDTVAVIVEVEAGQSTAAPSPVVRLHSGKAKGATCEYEYLIGVQADSLQFVSIESACPTEKQVVEFPVIVPTGVQLRETPHRAGVKIGWEPGADASMIGLQYAWNGIYAAGNYVPAHKGWMFEGGFLVPLGQPKIKKPTVVTPNTSAIGLTTTAKPQKN